MTARTPATTRSPVLALALALVLVLLLSQQFSLQHGVSHLGGGLVERGATTAPGAGPGVRGPGVRGQVVRGQLVAAPAAAGSTSNRVGSWANSWASNRAGSSADSTTDSSTDTLCPVCLVLTALGAASLLGLLRWLVALQASGAPTAPACRTVAWRARRQHRARAPPAALALT